MTKNENGRNRRRKRLPEAPEVERGKENDADGGSTQGTQEEGFAEIVAELGPENPGKLADQYLLRLPVVLSGTDCDRLMHAPMARKGFEIIFWLD